MEYYNVFNTAYTNALQQKHRRYKLKLELLTNYESVIGEITKDVSVTAKGQININNQQLTRRSCSLTLINVDNVYIPSENNLIWYNRKFKLWLGIVTGEDVYWHSCGVFFTTSATGNNGAVSIEAIDKGGVLDGTAKLNMLETQYIVSTGSKISNVVKDTLMLNSLNSPIDPISPLIDLSFNKIVTQAELSVDSNNYIGELLKQLADGYGADIYYDTDGHLVFGVMADSYRVDGYKYTAHQWDYSDLSEMYENSQVQYSFDGINTVTVYTDSSELENVSYTAYNNNPISPLRISSIGIRRLDSKTIPYTETNAERMKKRCKEYADYLLFHQSMLGMNVSFSSPIIPHMNVNSTIGLTDSRKGFENNTFVVQSITIPLSADKMTVTATNINWLPSDVNIEKFGV